MKTRSGRAFKVEPSNVPAEPMDISADDSNSDIRIRRLTPQEKEERAKQRTLENDTSDVLSAENVVVAPSEFLLHEEAISAVKSPVTSREREIGTLSLVEVVRPKSVFPDGNLKKKNSGQKFPKLFGGRELLGFQEWENLKNPTLTDLKMKYNNVVEFSVPMNNNHWGSFDPEEANKEFEEIRKDYRELVREMNLPTY